MDYQMQSSHWKDSLSKYPNFHVKKLGGLISGASKVPETPEYNFFTLSL